MAKTKVQAQSVADTMASGLPEIIAVEPHWITVTGSSIRDLQGNLRKVPDPTKDGRVRIGIERVLFTNLKLIHEEVAFNNRIVYGPDNDDPRFRFFGFYRADAYSQGTTIEAAAAVNDAWIEVAFYGTGLNILTPNNATAGRTIEAFIDGVSQGNIMPLYSNLLSTDWINTHNVHKVNTTTLAQGFHVALIKKQDITAAFNVYGFEILNEVPDIQVWPSTFYTNGVSFHRTAMETTPYDSDFDGNPVLTDRGGRVLIYQMPDGTIGKAIQQPDVTPRGFTGTVGSHSLLGTFDGTPANHANEELLKVVNPRQYGLNNGNDFTTLSTSSSDRSWHLNDGTFLLNANDIAYNAGLGGAYYGLDITAATDFLEIHFVGTGLDILNLRGQGNPLDTWRFYIDGYQVNVANSLPAGHVKICSGLPFGTHVVRIQKVVDASGAIFGDILVYVPKKPTIPTGAKIIGEYYLMADYARIDNPDNTAVSLNQKVSRGVVRKTCLKEMHMFGSWATGRDVNNYTTGWYIYTSTLNNYAELTFYGTGMELRFMGYNTRSNNIEVRLNGALLDNTHPYAGTAKVSTTSAPNTQIVYGSPGVYGVQNLSAVTTAKLNQDITTATNTAACFAVYDLPLGRHTIRFTNKHSGGQMMISAMEVIQPIYFIDTDTGNQTIKSYIDYSTVKKKNSVERLGYANAKAWCTYDEFTNTIIESYNIAGVTYIGGAISRFVFLKKFKRPPAVLCSSQDAQTIISDTIIGVDYDKFRSCVDILTTSSDGTANASAVKCIAVFGELEEE